MEETSAMDRPQPMSSTSLVSLSSLIDDAKCYALVRQQRWPDGVRCPACGGATVIRHGRDDTQEQRQRYRCSDCRVRFDDLTGTVLAGRHQPLRVWVLCMLANVQQVTIRPVIEATVARGALVHTDEYDVYARLEEWGYGHKTVCHARGEYARDDDGDGFCEVHVNTMEGLWSFLRSWLRPHRGVSQEKLPAYLAFFEVVHNARRRGKALLATLIGALVT